MIELSSPRLSISVSPERGGAITSVFSNSTNDEWIFFDENRRPQNSSLECYDDVWCGGFEELFPNDALGIIDGRPLKDHGELWQQKWNVVEQNETEVSMELQCTTVPALVRKRIAISTETPVIDISYSIQNTSAERYPYLFKLHPAMRIEAGDEILLPNGEIIPVDLSFSKIIGAQGPFQWPTIIDKSGNQKNIAYIPAKSELLQEFIYVKNISGGWCGLRRKRTGEKFFLKYPQEVFPYCWFFMALGGWREYYTVVMEPCTNFPKDMNAAIANGTCAMMRPNEIRQFSISVSIEK